MMRYIRLAVSILVSLSTASAALAQYDWTYNPNTVAPAISAYSLKAEASYKADLEKQEKSDPNGRGVVTPLIRLAEVYKEQGRYRETQELLKRAFTVETKTELRLKWKLAEISNNLAVAFALDGKYAEAEPLFKSALALKEKLHGPNDMVVAYSLDNLAGVYCSEGQYAEAEPLYKRSLAIWERLLSPDIFSSGVIATKLNNLAYFYYKQGKYEEAEPLFKRALAILDHTLDPSYHNKRVTLSNYARLLRKTNRTAEAAELDAKANAVRPADNSQNNPVASDYRVRLEYQPLLNH